MMIRRTTKRTTTGTHSNSGSRVAAGKTKTDIAQKTLTQANRASRANSTTIAGLYVSRFRELLARDTANWRALR